VSEHVCIAGVGEGEGVCLVEHVGSFFVDGATGAQELGIQIVGLVFYGPEDVLAAREEVRVDLQA
jgi:hypothetical protein